jgi:hypothetical protein
MRISLRGSHTRQKVFKIDQGENLFALILLTLLFIHLLSPNALAQGSAFTYQGQLGAGGSPTTGRYDLIFTLFGTNIGGIATAAPITNTVTTMSNGLFTVTLDFGAGVLTGNSYWLDISVSPSGSNTFTELFPRQPILPVPYAMMANNASNLLGTLPAGQLSGTVQNSSLPANPAFSGTVTANAFSGSGSGLTGLNPANFSAGTAGISISGSAVTAVTANNSASLNGVAGTNYVEAQTNQNVQYIATGGNNSAALLGRFDKPWANFQAAATNLGVNEIASNFVYNIGPGTFTDKLPYASAGYPSLENFAIVGQGPGVSVIQYAYPTAVIGNSGYNFANGSFSSLTWTATNVWSFPTFFTYPISDEPISNSFYNCTFNGGGDNICFNADEQFNQFFKDCSLVSGWDLWASIGASPLGGTTNSSLKFYNCILDINTARDPANSDGYAHVINASVIPALDIERTKINIVGATSGLIDFGTNEAGPVFQYVITNAPVTLVDDVINVSGSTYCEGPSEFLNHVYAYTPNVYLQNVVWVSNGAPFRLPDTSPNISAMAEMQLSGIQNNFYWTNNTSACRILANYTYIFGQNFMIGAPSGEMTNQFAGTYELSWYAELADASSDGGAFKGAIFTNGVQCTPLSLNNLDQNEGVAAVVHLGDPVPTPVYLPAGTAIDLRINDSLTNGWNMLIGGLKASRLTP